ncbi:hypothetical protein HPP92_018198 [Vanilla planifolia]|uniref:Uncharacterized protein n=1 Tax=Vanilla planifolia TaxID=51239 RepID=A0A835UMR4_VANPL|nr:hypothetical protein HPP92_018808 [Vanilla planifolia]KAG0468870.1 hypothetical protein HPP92_018198 [Vanilla planifolia]
MAIENQELKEFTFLASSWPEKMEFSRHPPRISTACRWMSAMNKVRSLTLLVNLTAMDLISRCMPPVMDSIDHFLIIAFTLLR